ncbi:MAG: anaerobic ribonucleoside-triphosphate reductase activating protein [Clostridia bacterium]|nr:anaerobic ribonucleoside-triphosphate reductase activating protein [Clostridia bacterium]
MNYGAIKETDIANGIGIRVSLFVSGCTHHCPGCFNSDTWDFAYGEPFDKATEDRILSLLSPDYINGLSLLGGEPMEHANQRVLEPFLTRVKEAYPQKTVWCYSGYIFEEMLSGRAHCEVTDSMLSMIDVLVDGPFVHSLKNIALKFRGSENQRIIDVPKSLRQGNVIQIEF